MGHDCHKYIYAYVPILSECLFAKVQIVNYLRHSVFLQKRNNGDEPDCEIDLFFLYSVRADSSPCSNWVR